MLKTILRRAIFFVLVFVLAVASADASILHRKSKPKPKTKSTASVIFSLYPELKGSKELMKKFNDIADDADLPRINDKPELELRTSVDSGYLVRVPDETESFYLDKDSFRDCFRVKSKKGAKETCFGDRRYLTPQALEYLNGLSGVYSDVFSDEKHQKRMKIPSLVRTMAYQRFISRGNPNAKEVLCDVDAEDHSRCSAHSTGYAFDVSTRDLEKEELLWIAGFLAKDIAAGKILAIYEYKAHQPNFHVMVIPK